jgi:hypothetical protein
MLGSPNDVHVMRGGGIREREVEEVGLLQRTGHGWREIGFLGGYRTWED